MAEVGAILMVGGNIAGYTRVMTTTIALETDKGNFELALTLSSGETQRLGLARALVLEPEVLFLDEPTASIDPQNTSIIEEIILKLKKEARALVIMATHDMEQVKRITDRVLKMEQGRIVEWSRPQDVVVNFD